MLLLLMWKRYWWCWIKAQVDKYITGINVVKVLRLLMTNTLWNQASGASVLPLSKIKVMLVFQSFSLVYKTSQVWIWKSILKKWIFNFLDAQWINSSSNLPLWNISTFFTLFLEWGVHVNHIYCSYVFAARLFS